MNGCCQTEHLQILIKMIAPFQIVPLTVEQYIMVQLNSVGYGTGASWVVESFVLNKDPFP